MSCLVVKMASVYKKGREARGALLEREVLLRQVRCSLLRPPHYRPTSGRRWESAENKRAAETQFTLSLSLSFSFELWCTKRRDNSPPPPLSTYSYENVEHDFAFTDPTFDESPVWEAEEWMEKKEPRDEVVGSWNVEWNSWTNLYRIKGFCN